MKFLLILISVIITFTGFPQFILSQSAYWVPQTSGTATQLDKVHFANSSTGIAIGPGILLRTSNSGNNWTAINTGIPSGYYAVKFKDENIVYVYGTSILYRSLNGGLNWTSVLNTGSYSRNIFIFGETILLPTSDQLYKSTDNGSSWSNTVSPASGAYNFCFINEYTGWSVGAQYLPPPNFNDEIYNRIYKTTNGGVNWTLLSNQISQVQPMYESIQFYDENTGYIAGLYGTRKSINSGNNWSIVRPGLSWNIYPLNRDSVWLMLLSNDLLLTTNGGTAWNTDSIHVRINDIFYVDKNTGWAVGSNGKIFITNTAVTGTGNQNELLPERFTLYQNYPNPFNPVTKIKYEAGRNNSFIKIEIFDVTGRRIKSLVNKIQNAGVYYVDFDASKFSSGIYFYRLIADNTAVDTKKMILLK